MGIRSAVHVQFLIGAVVYRYPYNGFTAATDADSESFIQCGIVVKQGGDDCWGERIAQTCAR